MARLKTEKKAAVPSDSDGTESEETESEPDEAYQLWLEAEDDICDLVESLKEKLADIHPGIGDRVSLSAFVRFIEIHSTCL